MTWFAGNSSTALSSWHGDFVVPVRMRLHIAGHFLVFFGLLEGSETRSLFLGFAIGNARRTFSLEKEKLLLALSFPFLRHDN